MEKQMTKYCIVVGLILFITLLGAWQTSHAASTDQVKKQISDWVDSNKDKMIRLSEAIWTYAELGMQEHRSSKALIDYLRAEGFKVETNVVGMPTAFVATWGTGKPAIGFISEYDSIPMVSNKAVPKQDPVVPGAPGHGCGHNLFGPGDAAAGCGLEERHGKE